MTMQRLLIALWLSIGLSMAGHAQAQGVGGAFGGESDEPIEITSDDGFEWQQDNSVFIARGNAKAVRGNVTVTANELYAYYRKLPSGGTDIWRLDAVGSVKIVGEGETVTGDKAVYDVTGGVLVVSGGKPTLVTAQDTITATEQLEYWEKKLMAVARGNAVAIRDGKRLRADVLAAYFQKSASGGNKVHRVDAFDNVRVKTAAEDARAKRGVYEVATGIATLMGDVKINRDGNVINGCRADINLNTGVSQMKSCPKASGERVRGVIMPSNKPDGSSNSTSGGR